jgi:signal transduction histidine kinase
MKTLKSQIALLALGISLFAATASAFLPHYVFGLRDQLFEMSLGASERSAFQNLVATQGQCAPEVDAFKAIHNWTAWELSYNSVLCFTIVFAAAMCSWLAFRYGERIAQPIQQVSLAANALRTGRARVDFPDTKGAVEITDLVESFARVNAWLKASDQDLRLRSHGIAHEIRTPLAIMRARLIGVQEKLYEPNAAVITGLLRQVDQIDGLTSDIGLLCDTIGSSQALQLSPVDAFELAEVVTHSLAPLAEASGVTVQRVGQPISVLGDAAKLERAIANLVQNALQHSGCKNCVLTIDRVGNQLQINCDDDGRGWPLDPPDKLIRPFVSGDADNQFAGGRSGLGLALVSAIVKAHGGDLALSASPMGGARATLSLPIRG